ncbi:DUF1097 family protein [Microbulbifer epialgicus]|uniref:DUF1097 family protein n=1 Tax=Microbulbifer epialgicus TaxID=393907 RepID=A0ABV4NXD6_9GAMM
MSSQYEHGTDGVELMKGATDSVEGGNTLVQDRLVTGLRLMLGISMAAVTALIGGMLAWVAVLGVVAYFSRGRTLGSGAYNLACAVTGLGLGLAAQAVVARWQLQPFLVALPAALLFAAVGAWAMGLVTGVRNMPSYAIGVLVALAAQKEVSLDSYLILIASISVGSVIAAMIDRLWPGRLALSC